MAEQTLFLGSLVKIVKTVAFVILIPAHTKVKPEPIKITLPRHIAREHHLIEGRTFDACIERYGENRARLLFRQRQPERGQWKLVYEMTPQGPVGQNGKTDAAAADQLSRVKAPDAAPKAPNPYEDKSLDIAPKASSKLILPPGFNPSTN